MGAELANRATVTRSAPSSQQLFGFPLRRCEVVANEAFFSFLLKTWSFGVSPCGSDGAEATSWDAAFAPGASLFDQGPEDVCHRCCSQPQAGAPTHAARRDGRQAPPRPRGEDVRMFAHDVLRL